MLNVYLFIFFVISCAALENTFLGVSSSSISLMKTVKTQLVTIKEEEAKMIATVFV